MATYNGTTFLLTIPSRFRAFYDEQSETRYVRTPSSPIYVTCEGVLKKRYETKREKKNRTIEERCCREYLLWKKYNYYNYHLLCLFIFLSLSLALSDSLFYKVRPDASPKCHNHVSDLIKFHDLIEGESFFGWNRKIKNKKLKKRNARKNKNKNK